jgi:hypothetical protein
MEAFSSKHNSFQESSPNNYILTQTALTCLPMGSTLSLLSSSMFNNILFLLCKYAQEKTSFTHWTPRPRISRHCPPKNLPWSATVGPDATSHNLQRSGMQEQIIQTTAWQLLKSKDPEWERNDVRLNTGSGWWCMKHRLCSFSWGPQMLIALLLFEGPWLTSPNQQLLGSSLPLPRKESSKELIL